MTSATPTTAPASAPAPVATGRPNKAAHHLLSGATSGLASAVILQPLDLVKTRLQQGPLPFPAPVLDLRNGGTPTTNIGGSGTAAAVAIGEVKGARVVGRGGMLRGSRVLPTVRRIVREEGVGALWRGTVPTVVRNVPGVAVYFYLLNEIRYTLSTTGYFAAAPSAATHSSSLAVVAARVPHTIRDASLVVGETFPAPPPGSIDLSLVAPEQAVSSSSALFSPTAAAAGKRAVSGGGSTIPRLQETGIGTTTAIETEGVPQRMTSALPKLNLQGNLVAGAVARTSVGFVLNPFTVLKSRYESNLYPTYTSLPRAFSQLLRTEGLRGLFQGFTATAARDAPYAGIYVVFYEEMKEVLGRLAATVAPGAPSAGIHTLSGISAATLATLATSPADCIKTKMQLLPEENPTIRSATRTIFQGRGLKGFFAGSSLRISRKACSSAIGWSVYEGLLLGLRDRKILN